jgi:hypothetical protein
MRFNMYVPHMRTVTYTDKKDGNKRKTMTVPVIDKNKKPVENVVGLDVIAVTYADAVSRRLAHKETAEHVTAYDLEMALNHPDAIHIVDTIERARGIAKGCRIEMADA